MQSNIHFLSLLAMPLLLAGTSCQTDAVTQKRQETSRLHAQRTGQTHTLNTQENSNPNRGTDPIRDLQYNDSPNYGSPPPTLDTLDGQASGTTGSGSPTIIEAPNLPSPSNSSPYLSPEPATNTPNYPYNPNYGVHSNPAPLQTPPAPAADSPLTHPNPSSRPTVIPSPPRRTQTENLPYGIPHPTKPGVVFSPYDRTRELRVGQRRTGEVLQDPDTKERFLCP